jgi:hypothetical protein
VSAAGTAKTTRVSVPPPEALFHQVFVEDAPSEPMTIRDPHTGLVSEDVFHSRGRVVTILDIKPNVLALDWLVAALAVAFDTHLRPDSNL